MGNKDAADKLYWALLHLMEIVEKDNAGDPSEMATSIWRWVVENQANEALANYRGQSKAQNYTIIGSSDFSDCY